MADQDYGKDVMKRYRRSPIRVSEPAATYGVRRRAALTSRLVIVNADTVAKTVRTSYRSPWQNGTAERWIANCRRELLEHVVVLSVRQD